MFSRGVVCGFARGGVWFRAVCVWFRGVCVCAFFSRAQAFAAAAPASQREEAEALLAAMLRADTKPRNGRVEADEFAALTVEQAGVVRRMYETVRRGQ